MTEPTRRTSAPRTPWLWRVMMWLNRGLVALTGRLEVTGSFPDELRGRPVLLAANHIGVFDAFVLLEACRRVDAPPRFMIAAGIMDAPIAGWGLRTAGHLRVERRGNNVLAGFHSAVTALKGGNAAVLVYPEGRISHDPGLWPERGKSGVARLALAADVPVIPVSQWGAHEAAYWGTETVSGWSDFQPVATSWLRAVRQHPTFRVKFGHPVDLTGLTGTRPGDAIRARDRIMRSITADLRTLRRSEPDRPRFLDPTRPTDSSSPWRPEPGEDDV
ncbi:MAG TPA: lysophospholipid acyltransferase family protein [Pseudonocardiaceae bacterium]|nr:lysophospholipid acyltransferase family protein [Pseudonocardiaceae bacterium]